MINILISLIHTLNSGFRIGAVLLVEIPVLRPQLTILKQSSKKRHRLGKCDRFVRMGLCR